MVSPPRRLNFLIINPNTNGSMTRGLTPLVDEVLSLHIDIQCDYFTAPLSDAPGAFNSINSPDDAYQSSLYCLPHLENLITGDRYDGFLIACYSEHPLVPMLRGRLEAGGRPKPIIGIFEASITACLGLGKFGIVTTGKIWEDALSRGVERFLGAKGAVSGKFLGVASTGLMASELHDMDTVSVRLKIRSAAAELVGRQKDIDAICVGCAGMVGFDDAIRQGVTDVLSAEAAQMLRVVEGVSIGLHWLIAICRST